MITTHLRRRAAAARAVEFNAADRNPEAPRGRFRWFAKRLVELAAPARQRGVDPGAPQAEEVLRELFCGADRAVVLERMTAGFNDRVARHRELLAIVNREPAPPHAEDFARVVAALRVRTAG